MKKIAVVLFSSLLALSLTACGGSTETSSNASSNIQTSVASTAEDESSFLEESEDEASIDEISDTNGEGAGPLLQTCFIDICENNNFYFDTVYSVIANGETQSIPMVLATDGDRKYMNFMMTVLDDGENTYILDSAAETATKTSPDNFTMDPDSPINTSNIEMISSGEEDFDGELCQYEEYQADNGDVVKFYFKDNAFVGFLSEILSSDPSSTVKLTVNTLSTDVPEELLTLPDDYTVTDTSEFDSIDDCC